MTSVASGDRMEVRTSRGKDTLSWSQVRTWTACRQKWAWLYEVGIVPKKVRRAPSIGSCGHEALAAIVRGDDWEAAVDKWLADEVASRGLWDEEVEEYRQVADLVRALIPRYQNYYRDTFQPVAVEQKFEVPISGLSTRLIGYWDAIVRDRDGALWLMENKMPQRQFRNPEDLLLDGQVGIYQWSAHRSGYPVVGTIYNQILARLPAEPSVNRDGSLSRARIYSDWETYKACVVAQGLDPADYAEMEDKLSGFEFFRRDYIYRPLQEVRLFSRDLQRKAWDMARTKKHIYRTDSYMTCSMCDYRELCVESAKGRDVSDLIEAGFEPKQNRREEQDENPAEGTN